MHFLLFLLTFDLMSVVLHVLIFAYSLILQVPVLFSFNPPIANTLPLSVISPVIAILLFIFLFVNALINAVVKAIPALGPSFGMAPSGTWI